MSGLVNALLIIAVVAVVVVRQCSARRISDDRRWWILPGILLVMSLREPGLMDVHHEALSVVVLGAELTVGLVTGATGAGRPGCGVNRTARCGARAPRPPSSSGREVWCCEPLCTGLPR